jgi:NTP pyrophosphatase (non-canonical NTP hydrolase)
MFTFKDYQEAAAETAMYPDLGKNIVYPALGLAGEAGEAAEVVKKFWRRTGTMDPHEMTIADVDKLQKELGDSLWYIARCCTEAGIEMELVALDNIHKLKDRKERGVIVGEGGER